MLSLCLLNWYFLLYYDNIKGPYITNESLLVEEGQDISLYWFKQGQAPPREPQALVLTDQVINAHICSKAIHGSPKCNIENRVYH